MTDATPGDGDNVAPAVEGQGGALQRDDSLLAGEPPWDDVRLRYIAAVLVHTGQNKAHAVKVLGIDRRTLNRILVRERRRGRWPL